MTQLVVEGVQAKQQIDPNVIPAVDRQQRGQGAIVILRLVLQLAQLQPVPVLQLAASTDKSAASFLKTYLLQNPAVGAHLLGSKCFQNDHHIDVAVLGGLAPAPAALQAHIEQVRAKGLLAGGQQLLQIDFHIKILHVFSLPLSFFYNILTLFVYRCPLQKASAFCSSSWTKASLPSQ